MMESWRGSKAPTLEDGRSLWPVGDRIPAQPTCAEKIADIKTVFFIYGFFKC